MKILAFTLIILFLACAGNAQVVKKDAALIMNNPKLMEVIPASFKVEILGEGFEWTEGPLWLETENKLVFSDIPNNTVFEWTAEGGIKPWLKPSGFTGSANRGGETGSNGLLLSPGGKLVLCQHGDRRMATMNAPLSAPAPEFSTLADNFEGKKFNSPNDACYHSNGDLYFTDPPYGLEFKMEDPAKELAFQGVYRLSKNGPITLLTKELSRPNGIAFSPDYSKLYVANSDPDRATWMVYDVDKNGLLQSGKVLFDATAKTKSLKGLPDGMKVHKNGWLFATGPGGVLIFTPKGEHLGTIMTNEATANCAFNTDFSVLYITADNYLLKVNLKKQ